MWRKFKGREVRENRDEGTSSRNRADHVRLRASEADQVQSDPAELITEWISKCEERKSEFKEQYKTIHQQSEAMRKEYGMYALFLSDAQRRNLQEQEYYTWKFLGDYGKEVDGYSDYLKQEKANPPEQYTKSINNLTSYFTYRINKANNHLHEITTKLDKSLETYKNLLEVNCSSIQENLEVNFRINLSPTEILEGLEKHLYQNVDAIIRKIKNPMSSGRDILCALVNESQKATGEPDKRKAQSMIAEKLAEVLDNEALSQSAQRILRAQIMKLKEESDEESDE